VVVGNGLGRKIFTRGKVCDMANVVDPTCKGKPEMANVGASASDEQLNVGMDSKVPKAKASNRIGPQGAVLSKAHTVAVDKDDTGVEQKIYLGWVKSQLDDESACLELPFTMILLISFACLALMHLNQQVVWAVEQAIEKDIVENANFAFSHAFGHKGLEDVFSFGDFWSWLRLGFLPLVVQPEWGYSEGYAEDMSEVFGEPGGSWSLIAAGKRCSQEVRKYLGSVASLGECQTLTLADQECRKQMYSNGTLCGCVLAGSVCDLLPSYDGYNVYEYQANSTASGAWQFGAYGSRAGQVPVTGEYMRYNRIVGGIRYRQELSEVGKDLCKFPGSAGSEVWSHWYGKPCFPATSESPFDPTSYDAESFTDPDRIEWMFMGLDTVETMHTQAVDMEDGCAQFRAKNRTECLCKWCAQQDPPSPWLNERTQRLEISIATYNPNYGLITLTGVNIFINRGSIMTKRIELMSSWIDLWSTPLVHLIPMLISDCVWISMLLYTLVNEVREIFYVIKKSSGRWYKSLYRDYISFWNLVDWISIGCAVLIFVGLYDLMTKQTTLSETLNKLILSERQEAGRHAYAGLVVDFYGQLELVCSQERLFRTSLCVYPMVVMLRLFKSFDAQPKLGVVTKTLVVSSQDMLHFGIVFFSVFCCLCLDAELLFGRDVVEFATFLRSMHSCFRLMFGDWDWDPMRDVNRPHAMFWFWLFMMMIVVILLNMLLAIIMEAYMEVKEGSSGAMTLKEQVTLLRRRRNEFKTGKRVRLTDIWNTFWKEERDEEAMLKNKRLITAEFLLDNVEGIPRSQAKRTLKNAWSEHVKNETPPFELSVAAERIQELYARSGKVRDNLFYTFGNVQYYDTMVGESERETMAASEADAANAASKLVEPPITEDVIERIREEIGRLSAETASILGQTMLSVDKRQNRVDQRQTEMLGMVREMQTALQILQSEASSLTTKLRCYNHQQEREVSRNNSWQRSLAGAVVPPCLSWVPVEAKAAGTPQEHKPS